MSLAIRLEDNVLIPAEVIDLATFRHWATSPAFPERGRIDYLGGVLEVNMTAEERESHGIPKGKLYAWMLQIVETTRPGRLFIDRTRLSHPKAGLSCEPDILFVSLEALQSGRARYVPSKTDKMMEIEGEATLVVEIISDSSVGKDLRRLPERYFKAGVEELWILDARGTQPGVKFEIRHRSTRGWKPAPVDPDGFQASNVLERAIRVRRQPWVMANTWQYLVDER
ncbi:MAG TPA: Uma2 family endonuclease [Candidatus Xenobia bacterium]